MDFDLPAKIIREGTCCGTTEGAVHLFYLHWGDNYKTLFACHFENVESFEPLNFWGSEASITFSAQKTNIKRIGTNSQFHFEMAILLVKTRRTRK